MDIEKIFGFLGNENTATPQKILSVIEEAKSFSGISQSEESEEVFNEDSFVDTTPVQETTVSEEDTEIEEFLSIFDGPLPTYDGIKQLTIPDIMKSSVSEAPSFEGELGMVSAPTETESFGKEGEDIADLLKDFKVGGFEEEYTKTFSTEDLESLVEKEPIDVSKPTFEEQISKEEPIGFGEGKFEEVEPEIPDFSFVGGEEFGETSSQEVGGFSEELFKFESQESFSVPTESKEEVFEGGGFEVSFEEPQYSQVEEIVRGMEEAESPEEEVFEQPLQEFSEEPIQSFGVSEQVETQGEEFENFVKVSEQERIYDTKPTYKEEASEYVKQQSVKTEEISDADATRAISLLRAYPYEIRKAVKDLIENNILSEGQINSLLKYVLSNPSSEQLKNYIKSIAPFYRFAEEGAGHRRVIYAAQKSKAEEAFEKVLRGSVLAVVGIGIIAIVGFIVFNTVSRNIYSENLYEKGLKLIDSGYYDEAENNFRRAEEIGGRKKEWYRKYALRYVYNNQPERAVKKLEDALKIWNYDYGLSLDYVDSLTKLPQPDFNKALKYSEEFRRVENNSFRGIDLNAQVYVKMGDYYKSKIHYKDAEVLYLKYLKSQDNKHIPSLFRLISIYIRLDNKEKVDELYDYIKRLNEKAVSEVVGIEMARYYIDKNDLSRAKKVLFEVYTIKPKDPDFYYEFARYFIKNENYREAVKNLRIALSLNSKHSKSYVLLGDIDYLTKNKSSAIENYKKALEIDPSLKEPYFKLGDIFYEDEEYNTALGYYLEGLRLGEPEDLDYLSKVNYNIARIYYRNSMLNESLRYLSASYVRGTYNPLISHFMGNIYLELGKPDMALVQYNKSIEAYNKIMEKIKVIDPKILRHRELVSFLIRSYNNQGVAYILIGGQNGVKNAMLSWWEAKNYAEKINSVYPNAEYNLKLVLHPTMTKYRNFSIDREIPDSIPSYIYSYIESVIPR